MTKTLVAPLETLNDATEVSDDATRVTNGATQTLNGARQGFNGATRPSNVITSLLNGATEVLIVTKEAMNGATRVSGGAICRDFAPFPGKNGVISPWLPPFPRENKPSEGGNVTTPALDGPSEALASPRDRECCERRGVRSPGSSRREEGARECCDPAVQYAVGEKGRDIPGRRARSGTFPRAAGAPGSALASGFPANGRAGKPGSHLNDTGGAPWP